MTTVRGPSTEAALGGAERHLAEAVGCLEIVAEAGLNAWRWTAELDQLRTVLRRVRLASSLERARARVGSGECDAMDQATPAGLAAAERFRSRGSNSESPT